MKQFLFLLTLTVVTLVSYSQVGIGTTTPNSSAALDVTGADKGLLIPRVALTSTTSALPLSSHVAGMIVWNTATAGSGNMAVNPGVYYNDGGQWRLITSNTPTASGSSNGTAFVSAWDCSSGAYSGTLTAGTPASGVTKVVVATVSTAGTYSITTPTVNGVYFSGSATFAGTGSQNVTLTASGTPIAAGSNNYSLNTSPNCSFSVTVAAPVFTCGTSTVTFTYNGASVTYGTIQSPTTGACFLDRNLGASAVATAYNDYNGYGDLFQWGRPADGHQLITRTSSTTATALNGTTVTLATSDIPGHSDFITNSTTPYDWRSDNNNNRWATNSQGPCPSGYHVPTLTEWAAETGITNYTTAYSQLKLTAAGYRLQNGTISSIGVNGTSWSSTISGTSSYAVVYNSGARSNSANFRAIAHPVRCRAN